MYQPYVYWIKNKTTGQKYVGVRYAKNCNPRDFWISYFTSSGLVHKLILLYGTDDFVYKILHTFNTAEDAILKEEKYIRIAILKPDYLNLCRFVTNSTSCSKAGKIGGRIQVEQKLGIHKQTKKERLAILSNAREIQYKMKKNPLAHASSSIQSARGARGGPKNKGFVWITNGTTTIKYSPKMQSKLSTGEFLIKNPTFRRGRK